MEVKIVEVKLKNAGNVGWWREYASLLRKDAITEEVIVPFNDNYTKVSCDSNGNFFKLNLSNFEYNRDYFIEIKTVRDGVVEYFQQKDLTFTVEK